MPNRPSRPGAKPPLTKPPLTPDPTHKVPLQHIAASIIRQGDIPFAWLALVLGLVAEQWRIRTKRAANHYSNLEVVVMGRGRQQAERIRDKGARRLGKLVKKYDYLQARRITLRRALSLLAEKVVVGARGELLTPGEAEARMKLVTDTVTEETDTGSGKHRRVARWLVRFAPLAVLVDFPVLLYFIGNVFNVDWNDLTHSLIPLLTSIVFAILGTAVMAVGLHFCGRELRAQKDRDGHIRLPGGRARLLPLVFVIASSVVITSSGMVMAYRIISDSLTAGNGAIGGVILGLFFAVISILLGIVIFSVTYRDGSIETEEIDHHASELASRQAAMQRLQKEIDDISARLSVLRKVGKRQYEAITSQMRSSMRNAIDVILHARSYHQGCGAEAELVSGDDEPTYGSLLPVIAVDTSVLDQLVEALQETTTDHLEEEHA